MIPVQNLPDIAPYNVSKWLKLPMLLSIEEMEAFLPLLPEPFVPVSGVIPEGNEYLNKRLFLELYSSYLNQIKQGIRRPVFDRRLTFVVTDQLESLRAAKVGNGLLIRPIFPVIQVQPYALNYSKVSEEFKDTAYSADSFYWGLVFSLPQLFQNPSTQVVERIVSDHFPIAILFKNIQRWLRIYTTPTPFRIEETTINHPARIGKNLLKGRSWIELPQN